MLVVHPKQLFLRSGHNNPNPNYVYWVEQLSEDLYVKLVKFLDAYKGQVFRRDRWVIAGYTLFVLRSPQISPQPRDRMTPAGESSWRLRSNAAVNSNLRRILRELNRGLVQDQTFRLDAAINSYPNIVRIARVDSPASCRAMAGDIRSNEADSRPMTLCGHWAAGTRTAGPASPTAVVPDRIFAFPGISARAGRLDIREGSNAWACDILLNSEMVTRVSRGESSDESDESDDRNRERHWPLRHGRMRPALASQS